MVHRLRDEKSASALAPTALAVPALGATIEEPFTSTTLVCGRHALSAEIAGDQDIALPVYQTL
jgi:hypothetical protein